MTDIAETNLKLAVGLPTAEALDVAAYLQQLDEWARLVATKTEGWLPMFYRSTSAFDNSLPKFRMMALVTVLQRDLGVCYDPACQEGPYCALDPGTLFIHGLLDGQGGTCVTMPVLYVAVGRRLGYGLLTPAHVVLSGNGEAIGEPIDEPDGSAPSWPYAPQPNPSPVLSTYAVSGGNCS